ncbi:hypothetical protein LZZ90_00945 [Flavobacterium sp. SM15]|uniref:hypothetical protein n=1 Tax=Flavobacterium sp. SM15 TaxID=2908005 RepID=UPI001ED9F1C2|nr:hypothetical protein [Flavobacterium sp. SM15]MCG2610067.1 hypothetical protein [Flavobacterium sp. SM15]
MLKNILNLEGAQKLTKEAQKTINGGITKECANMWATMFCVPKTTATCPPDLDGNPGTPACTKCCY